MRHLLTLILGLTTTFQLTYGQTFSDSLKSTLVSQLTANDTLTIYISRRSCFGGGIEKFYLTSSSGHHTLTAFRPISLYELRVKFDTLRLPILPDTLVFSKMNSYSLSDSNMVAWAGLEHLGVKCGIRPRGSGGAIGIYRMKLNGQIVEFSDKCYEVSELRDFAIPEQYFDEWYDLEAEITNPNTTHEK